MPLSVAATATPSSSSSHSVQCSRAPIATPWSIPPPLRRSPWLVLPMSLAHCRPCPLPLPVGPARTRTRIDRLLASLSTHAGRSLWRFVVNSSAKQLAQAGATAANRRLATILRLRLQAKAHLQ
eukprot:scaffold4839_cov136-Isochrysis_galbana.AAC.4